VRARDIAIRNLASPYGLTGASVLLFLVAYFFPPSLYLRFVSEPDYLFLDPSSLLFFLLCVLGFLAGLFTFDYSFHVPNFAQVRRTVRLSPMLFILLPLILGICASLLADAKLLRDNPNLLALLIALQASDLKEAGGMEISGPISQATPILMGIVWWTIFRRDELDLHKRQRVIVTTCIVVASFILLLSSMLIVARGELMPVLCGIAIIALIVKQRKGKLSPDVALKFGLGFAGLILATFIGISLLRGINTVDPLITNVIGYTFSSYNRLACLLSGKLRYPFSGKGVYISGFVAFNRSFNAIFPISRFLDWANFDTVWRSEFDAVSAAGLNGTLIWSGAFGYVFSDLGWFAPFLLFMHGLLTGWAWMQLKLAKPSGIILYPWCAFCILFWFGTNYLLDPKVADLIVLVPLFAAYEAAFSRYAVEAK
jgi:hypothetical protein